MTESHGFRALRNDSYRVDLAKANDSEEDSVADNVMDLQGDFWQKEKKPPVLEGNAAAASTVYGENARLRPNA